MEDAPGAPNSILLIFNKISEKYKKYSKEEYNKNLNRELDYLKNQEKIYVENFENSFKKIMISS